MIALLVALVLAAAPLGAAEYVLLDTGATLRVDGHELSGDKIRLKVNGGYIDMPAGSVLGFQPEGFQTEPAPPPKAPEPALADPYKLIENEARKWNIPEQFLHSVVKSESGYKMTAVSPKGAVGLMQLMPSTARDLSVDPHNLIQNVQAGTRYLAELLLRYNGKSDLALAAYNAGPGAVDRYKGLPPYRETRQYVYRILRDFQLRSEPRP